MGKTLVTGATGFTGWNLCKRLIHDGERVTAFVRPGPRVTALQRMGVECKFTDITDPVSVSEGFDGIERVYHIAAAYRTEHSDKEEFNRVNVEATRNLLEAARKAEVKRFVHCSTVGVQGEIENAPADENYRFKPGDHYQKSKLAGELTATEYFDTELPVSIVRPVGIYGAGDTRFLKLFKPINKGTFVMVGSGEVLYHMTYIDDLVEGIVLCGHKPEAVGEVFTIGGERYSTLRELCMSIGEILGKSLSKFNIPYYPVYLASILCDKVCRLVGLNPPLYPRRVEFFALDRAFSIQKAEKLLDYKPKVGLREGLRRTAEWYKQEGLI